MVKEDVMYLCKGDLNATLARIWEWKTSYRIKQARKSYKTYMWRFSSSYDCNLARAP